MKMNRIAFIDFSIALFLLFRYLRAGKHIILFFISLFFIGLAIFESKNNLLSIFVLSIIALAWLLLSIIASIIINRIIEIFASVQNELYWKKQWIA